MVGLAENSNPDIRRLSSIPQSPQTFQGRHAFASPSSFVTQNSAAYANSTPSWIRPSGKSIDKEGIEPDIAVEITDADRSANRDPQLDKALSVLQGM